jgi:hypothetical protein
VSRDSNHCLALCEYKVFPGTAIEIQGQQRRRCADNFPASQFGGLDSKSRIGDQYRSRVSVPFAKPSIACRDSTSNQVDDLFLSDPVKFINNRQRRKKLYVRTSK